MSMISELVNELRSESDKCQARHNLLYVAASVIEELSAKLTSANMEHSEQFYNDGWILCSERLPEEKGTYLVTIKRFGITFARFSGMKDNLHFDSNVIAWQPLPQPYVKGE